MILQEDSVASRPGGEFTNTGKADSDGFEVGRIPEAMKSNIRDESVVLRPGAPE